MKKYDVVALGELLIDFTESGLSPQGNPLLEANPGGAPCNALAMLAKLGKKCAFIGKVGRDSFGDMLENAVREAGIDTAGLRRDEEVHTTLAVVHTLPGGEREFSFYRKPGADVRLSADDLEWEMLKDCRIFHFGSLSLTDEPCRSATYLAVTTAKKAGALISFDPNLRVPLWPSLPLAKSEIRWGLSQCDVLKISDNELEFMTGETDFDKGAAILRNTYPNIRLINVTAGRDGSFAYYGDLRVYAPICDIPGVIEKTGAGDTFCGSALGFILERGLDGLSESDLRDMLRFANAAAALVTTKKGALRVMPERTEVERLI